MAFLSQWFERLRQAGWRAWLLYGLLGLFVGGMLLWSGLNVMHAEPPEPLWGADDLPALPPDGENGWVDLTTHAAEVGGVSLGPICFAVRDWLAEDRPSSAPTAADLEAAAGAFARADVQAAWQRCQAALVKPTFVDACPIDYSQRCPALEIAQCHRLTSYVVLSHAAKTEWQPASESVEQLLRQGGSHVSSARSWVGMLIALHNLRGSFRLCSAAMAWASGSAQGPDLALVERALGDFVPEEVDFASAVIGEYLAQVQGVALIARGEADSPQLGLPGFFFDPGATVAELNGIYAPALAARGRVMRPELPTKPYAAGFGWWVRNPLGKLYLDAVQPPPPVLTSLETARREMVSAHEQLVGAAATP